MKNIVLLGMLLITFSCAHKVNKDAMSIKLMKNDPDGSCEDLGQVIGDSGIYTGDNSARNDLRNNAFELGANYVRMEKIELAGAGTESKITGTAFKCPNKK